MSPSEKAYQVSWEQFHRDAKALAWRLMEKQNWEAIIAITRGGLVPAGIVARELDVRVIETICVSSYKSTDEGASAAKERGSLNILKPVGESVTDLIKQGKGSSILVVDDLVDTGNTGKLVRKLLPEAHLATVYAKPEGRKIVDTFVTEVSQDTWIYFPWDLSLQFSQPAVSTGI